MARFEDEALQVADCEVLKRRGTANFLLRISDGSSLRSLLLRCRCRALSESSPSRIANGLPFYSRELAPSAMPLTRAEEMFVRRIYEFIHISEHLGIMYTRLVLDT
jgi:hypothetical protein